jgi:hypothetical protein
MRQMLRADRKHAIASGGSTAGLLAARLRSDHFGCVSLIQPRRLFCGSRQRRGVPQRRLAHGLLASGRNVLEKLFPGVSEALLKAGAMTGDIARDSRWFFGECLLQPPHEKRDKGGGRYSMKERDCPPPKSARSLWIDPITYANDSTAHCSVKIAQKWTRLARPCCRFLIIRPRRS